MVRLETSGLLAGSGAPTGFQRSMYLDDDLLGYFVGCVFFILQLLYYISDFILYITFKTPL